MLYVAMCLPFSQTYDDCQRKLAEDAGDKKGVYKFSSESDNATQMMDDLKRRVMEAQNMVCMSWLRWGV